MDITGVELSKIQADISGHRHRVGRLLEDVDALRRCVVELGVGSPTGRTGALLELCTSQIRAGDVAMGQAAAYLNAVRVRPAEGYRPRVQGMTDGKPVARRDLSAHW
jgi:hypothetical protein